LTLRQLLWMAEGQGRERWAHTSLIAAILANANRDPKKGRALRPEDFDPYATRQSRPDVIEVNQDNIGLLRQAFTGKR
jgi:hypothetical protein